MCPTQKSSKTVIRWGSLPSRQSHMHSNCIITLTEPVATRILIGHQEVSLSRTPQWKDLGSAQSVKRGSLLCANPARLWTPWQSGTTVMALDVTLILESRMGACREFTATVTSNKNSKTVCAPALSAWFSSHRLRSEAGTRQDCPNRIQLS